MCRVKERTALRVWGRRARLGAHPRPRQGLRLLAPGLEESGLVLVSAAGQSHTASRRGHEAAMTRERGRCALDALGLRPQLRT